jgi:3-phenylpropionate/trans-cinnamate dioxygenase ferredoxin subunit
MEKDLNWRYVCGADDIDEEDVRRFEDAGRVYAIYHTPSGYYASDGLCTHEVADLTQGLVFDEIIECPMHLGRFHIPTGKAKGAPVCINLKTYRVRVDEGRLFIAVPV